MLQAGLGWQGIVMVDGVSYSWMGDDVVTQQNISRVTNIQITPTRTIYVMSAGPLNLTVTFLSPIEVSSLAHGTCAAAYGISCNIAYRLRETVNALIIPLC